MRCLFMNRTEFKEATEKAISILEKINYCGEGFVSTDDIINAVAEVTNTDITFSYLSFSKEGFEDDYGAMMCVYKAKGIEKQKAKIILNNDKDSKFMRFSLMHELGHLITKHYTIEDDDSEYTVSAHIQYNITSLPKEVYKDNIYLLNEQIANVFALQVLMPSEAFSRQMFKNTKFQGVADHFGVTADAVRSRALLGC